MKVFETDGFIYSFLNKIADILILNIMYIISCIPIITIGAANTALSYATIKLVRNEGYPVRNFIRSFKENFKQATLLWVPIVIIFSVIGLNIFMFMPDAGKAGIIQFIVVVNIALLILSSFIIPIIFPVLSRFHNTLLQILTNGIYMAFQHLPWMMIVYLFTWLPMLLVMFFPRGTSIILVCWGIFGFALFSYCSAYIYEKKIFKDCYESEV